jgi:DNA-binding response OmpR family regulator
MAPQRRILIVEDEHDIAEMYQYKLQLDGYLVAIARDGMAGLDLTRSLKPDLILIDTHLPHLDGLQMLSALREDGATRRLPVIMVSDDDSRPVVHEAERLEAVAYLVKAQILPSALSRTIAAALEGSPAGEDAPEGTRKAS